MTSVTVTNESTCSVNESRVPKTEIRLCTLDEFKVKADPLFQEHYEEIALRKDLMELKPNWPMYDALDKSGSLFIYLAMQNDVCIGYSMNLVTNHLHYADLKYSQNDVLFIKKEFRGGRIGLRLMKITEDYAKSLGCKVMLWHAKEHTTLSTLLPRLKYGVQDIVFSKEL
tara:strand:+ start:592 stop:1101 length:510 start_codon:yes stop_codon:yes gene_type:complete